MIEHLVRPLDRPDLAYVLPRADGRTWYPKSFLVPRRDNEPRLGHALATMDLIRRSLGEEGVVSSRIVWLGFSQGACVVSEYVARSAHRCAGLVSLTGGLVGARTEELSRPTNVAELPSLFATSDVDELVPLARVRRSAELFTEAGAAVTLAVYADAPHEIVDEAVADCREALTRIHRAVAAGT